MFLALPLFALWMGLEKRGLRSQILPLGRKQGVWLLLSGLFFAGDLTVWHWSIKYTSVANATLLANFSPIFVTAAAWFFFKERVSSQFLLGMAAALGGAALLVQGDLSTKHLMGDALALSAAVLYAGYLITLKELRQYMSTASLMGISSLISCLALLLISVLAGENLIAATLQGWMILLAMALISQFAGQGLIAYGLAYLPASLSSVSLLLQPVGATALAWVILGESMSWLQGLGGIIVLLGIFLAQRSSIKYFS